MRNIFVHDILAADVKEGVLTLYMCNPYDKTFHMLLLLLTL